MAENSCDDASQVDPLLNQVPNSTNGFYGDGAYDKWKVYETLDRRRTKAIIPPQRNAKIKQHGNTKSQVRKWCESLPAVATSPGVSGVNASAGWSATNSPRTTTAKQHITAYPNQSSIHGNDLRQ